MFDEKGRKFYVNFRHIFHVSATTYGTAATHTIQVKITGQDDFLLKLVFQGTGDINFDRNGVPSRAVIIDITVALTIEHWYSDFIKRGSSD